MAVSADELEQALQRISQAEAGIASDSLANRLLQKLGPTRPFVALYRRLGPMVDPWLQRSTGGRIASRLYGFPALLLHTTGAKSGQPRTSPLLYARDGNDFLVVGTNFGQANHPAWTANLRKHPQAEISVFEERLSVRAQQLNAADFKALWPRFSAIYGGYYAYLERLTERSPRMFRLTPQAD